MPPTWHAKNWWNQGKFVYRVNCALYLNQYANVNLQLFKRGHKLQGVYLGTKKTKNCLTDASFSNVTPTPPPVHIIINYLIHFYRTFQHVSRQRRKKNASLDFLNIPSITNLQWNANRQFTAVSLLERLLSVANLNNDNRMRSLLVWEPSRSVVVIRPKRIGHDIETVGLGTFSQGHFRAFGWKD